MENFRTEVVVNDTEKKIFYGHKNFFIGSCFTQNIGGLLQSLKFNADINPFGVLYNPLSISNSLKILIDGKTFGENDLHFFNDKWISFSHHGSFSDTDKKKCLENINSRISLSSEFLKNTDTLFITFGTAWVYEYQKTYQVVSNCHKIPAKEFNRFILSVDNIVKEYTELIEKLRSFNQKLRIVFTVSPIRHWKDGAVNNQVSKSTLILAIDQLRKNIANIDYFPAYEIMMDDLRDYRFYNEDMLHPSSVAIKYISQKFIEAYIDESSRQLIKQIEKIVKAKEHRPFDVASESHQKFLKKQLDMIGQITSKHPYINFSDEEEFFKSCLL